MIDFDPRTLVPLYRDEERAFHHKEDWQRRMIAWFGLGAGISFALEFARAYYFLIASRSSEVAMGNGSLDLEFNALLGIGLGIFIAVVPVFFAFRMSRNKPQAFAAQRFDGSRVMSWLSAIMSLFIAVGIIVLGALFTVNSIAYKGESGLGEMTMVVLFGTFFLAGPLVAEGVWSIFATSRGIKNVYVLRQGKWKKG